MIDTICIVLCTQLALASIAQGEVSVIHKAASAVLEVALNREAYGWGLVKGWNGYDPMCHPEEWAWREAQKALWQGGDANGDKHAFSKADMEKLGFDKSEFKEICTNDGRWCEYIGGWPDEDQTIGNTRNCDGQVDG